MIHETAERVREFSKGTALQRLSEFAPIGIAVAVPFVGLGLLPALFFNRFKALTVRKKEPYPVFDFKTVRDQFKFPVNHPIEGVAYACCKTEPNLYVPLAAFHQYMYEEKMAAFHELCANLGVRHCTVIYAKEDGQDITVRVSAAGIPTHMGPLSVGLGTSTSQHSNANTGVFAEYPPPNRPLTELQSGWMNGEPTWGMMQKLRFERNLERWRAEFSYLNDMGINANVVAKIAGVGIDIGGTFKEMHQRKWIFDVAFWPHEPS